MNRKTRQTRGLVDDWGRRGFPDKEGLCRGPQVDSVLSWRNTRARVRRKSGGEAEEEGWGRPHLAL